MNRQPSAEHYRLLRRLRRLVLRSEEAALIFLWGDDRRSFDWLRGELDRALRARSRCVVALAIPEAAGAVDVGGVAGVALAPVVAGVLAPAPGTQTFAAWVNMGWSVQQQPLRDWLLARLNERRGQLLLPRRAVLLCGPMSAEARAGEVAPDLWAVRSASLHVPAWAAVPEALVAARMPAGDVLPSRTPYSALWEQAWAATRNAPASVRPDVSLGLLAAGELLRDRKLDAAHLVLAQTDRKSVV